MALPVNSTTFVFISPTRNKLLEEARLLTKEKQREFVYLFSKVGETTIEGVLASTMESDLEYIQRWVDINLEEVMSFKRAIDSIKKEIGL